ncbi:MAG TPA: CNNM domain-containing protein [Desulfuromonadales bacterium]|nr:CNNM domain-containing protein [Desulfuromonadales bacterium]
MTSDQWLHLLGLGVLFLFSAFFSGSETALMSMDRFRVKYLADKDWPGARRLDALLDNPENLLSTILVGNNLVNIAVSVFATTLLIDLFGARGEILTILILTPMLLIFAEVCPKTYAAKYPEKLSFRVLLPIRLAMWLLTPVNWLVTRIVGLLTRLLSGEEMRPIISEDEIRTMIKFGETAGVVAKDKRRMLHGVFDLAQIRVRDVMVPRTEIIGIAVDTPFSELIKIGAEARHSRFPVYDGDFDQIVGIIHIKEILSFVGQPEAFSMRNVARSPYFVPEAKSVEALLQAFRRKQVHLAVVVDEYGGVEGIVTLEDIVEEIVGEIQDEYDLEDALIRPLKPGVFMVDGSTPLRDINRRFGLTLSEEHVNTLAGFLLHLLERIPQEGDQCETDGVRFTVRRMEEHRVEEIEMRLLAFPEKTT